MTSRASIPAKIWTLIFALWVVFLSGAFASVVGSPGVIQARGLRNLLSAKQLQVTQLEKEIEQLESERKLLEKSSIAQEREIRRVLGYAAPDELIFDFSAADQLTGSSN